VATSTSGFKARFTEFAATSDATVALHLADAGEFINADAWGDRADLGTYYLAAHWLTKAVAATAGATGPSGLVSSESLGPASRSYAVPTSIGATDAEFSSTHYGQKYLAMQAAVFTSRVYGVA
jgi:hypothetical protein